MSACSFSARWLVLAALASFARPSSAEIDADAGPPERLRISHQRIEEVFDAPTLAGLRSALRESPRFGGHGQTHSSFELAQQLHADASSCRLINYQLQVQISVHLPRWTPARPVGAREQGNWPQALAALQAHEAGHVGHAEQAARELDAQLQPLIGERRQDCARLQSAIERKRMAVLMRLQLKDSLYDDVTDFGRLDVAPPKPERRRPPVRDRRRQP